MMADCLTCGTIEIAYVRSKDGSVVHRISCPRSGATSKPWHYAARELGNDHSRIVDEIDALPWIKACSYCMGDDLS